jgi:hypothetical protein
MKTGENDIIKDKINEDNENNIIDERANNTLNDKINDINGENNKFELKSENIYNDLEKFIEKNIENKINNLLETLPNNVKNIKDNNNFYDLSLRELYKNTLQTIIDIINDISNAYSNEYIDNNNYIYIIIDILSKEERRLYVGIILLFLSFIIYFIDGASV